MTGTARRPTVHPLHGTLLAFPMALFPSAVASDIAYLKTAELQWTNFSAWLISGGLVFGGLVTAWALLALLFGLRGAERVRRLIYFAALAVMWILGLVNAFKHSQDGWSSVGAFGLGLSILTSLLALAAGMLAFSGFGRDSAR